MCSFGEWYILDRNSWLQKVQGTAFQRGTSLTSLRKSLKRQETSQVVHVSGLLASREAAIRLGPLPQHTGARTYSCDHHAVHFRVGLSHKLAYIANMFYKVQHGCYRWIWFAPVFALGCCCHVVVYGSKTALAISLVLASSAFWPAHPYWPAFVHSRIWDCWRR